MPSLLGSQECLHSSPLCFHFLHFLYQNEGEKGSLAFFQTIYFYAFFQKLLQECPVGSWTPVTPHWSLVSYKLTKGLCAYSQDH